MAGRRLKPHQRREQLLDVGAAMFAEMPYEDVFVEDIATKAGVSRALLYHYFPSKRDLYVAIFKRASNRLLACGNPDPQLPLADQLASGLEAHIRYFADHPFEGIAINRGALSDDPAIQAIVTVELNVIGQRLINKLVTEGHPRDITEIAVDGWLAFVRAACVKWVQSRKITRAALAEMCLRAFNCAVYPNTPNAWPEEVTAKCLRSGALKRPGNPGGNVAELITTITTRAEHWNRIPKLFVWKASTHDIIAKFQRTRDTPRRLKTPTDR